MGKYSFTLYQILRLKMFLYEKHSLTKSIFFPKIIGETILHLCLLNATSLHADLAKRLLRFYPKLINDIYMCDEYYGNKYNHFNGNFETFI